MNSYFTAHLIHLFCALIFVGGIFFEMLILSAIHSKKLDRDSRRQAEALISQRARRVMPPVVAALFLSGLVMAHRYADLLRNPLANSFSLQFSLKILLALSVLVHFIIAVRKMKRQTLTAAWSKYIHTAVFIHVILIVALAKTMLFL